MISLSNTLRSRIKAPAPPFFLKKKSLAEKNELGELVEKYKKKADKEVKAICHFSMQNVSTRSN